jgi:hypothetical protein
MAVVVAVGIDSGAVAVAVGVAEWLWLWWLIVVGPSFEWNDLEQYWQSYGYTSAKLAVAVAGWQWRNGQSARSPTHQFPISNLKTPKNTIKTPQKI